MPQAVSSHNGLSEKERIGRDGKENMNFGEVIEIMKKGGSVQREGWNGKGMYIYLGDFAFYGLEPTFVMRTALGKFQPGWVPSQADMLATDWSIY